MGKTHIATMPKSRLGKLDIPDRVEIETKSHDRNGV